MSIEILTETIRTVTGLPDAKPRPGQKTLTDDIVAAIATTGNAIGCAPTGLGKSFALLAPAMEAAARDGLRTIISTESLSLLSQIVDKDAPVVADACQKLTGTRPAVAVLKGFSNYVCSATARTSAEAIAGLEGTRPTRTALIAALKRIGKRKRHEVDGRAFDTANGIPMLLWAINLGATDTGDRQSYDGVLTSELWDLVSVGPGECDCADSPDAEGCKPAVARAKAADADIVVTNHSMLAVQAAKGVPVLIGNRTLGAFHIIMVDEAHALPDTVRGAGSGEISSATVASLARSLTRVLDEMDPAVDQAVKEGTALAVEIQEELTAHAHPERGSKVTKVGEDADPLDGTGEVLLAWARSMKGMLEKSTSSPNPKLRLKAKKLTGRFDNFMATISQVRLHKVGTARWIEEKTPPRDARNQQQYLSVNASPVNIGSMLLANLWTAPVLEDLEDPMTVALKEAGEPADQEVETYPMIVVAVSATLPNRFGYQIGLGTENKDYPSPFDQAYGSSMLYIPKPDEDDIAALYPDWRRGTRGRFNVPLHETWAAEKNVRLVEANSGSALILAAKSSSGKQYVQALRASARGRWNVYSQWDGLSVRQMVQQWREDETSVLVGTRSLMTGVDAPGETCSLVTVDRVPRAASNPVGDARIEAIMDAQQIDKWSADRFVYVSDAALLLEQAAGRLIRSMGDKGMFAILDPRMLKNGPVAYPEPTRLAYKKAVQRFTRVATSLRTAQAFLQSVPVPVPEEILVAA